MNKTPVVQPLRYAGKVVLKVDVWELNTMKQGASVRVLLRNRTGVAEIAWEFDI